MVHIIALVAKEQHSQIEVHVCGWFIYFIFEMHSNSVHGYKAAHFTVVSNIPAHARNHFVTILECGASKRIKVWCKEEEMSTLSLDGFWLHLSHS